MGVLTKDVNSVAVAGGVSDLDGVTILPALVNHTTGRWKLSAIYSGGGTSVAYYNETPTGAVNGINTVFTLSQTPLANSLVLTIARQPQILITDYTISGNTITYTSPPSAGLTPHNAIYAVQSGTFGGTISVETPGGAINGINSAYTTVNAINTVITMDLNGQFINPSQYTFVSGTSGFSMNTPIPAAFTGLPFTIVYV